MPDHEGMARLRIDGGSELGTLLERGGFDEIDRYDGHHAPGEESGYPAFLRAHGYDGADPWTEHVIAGIDASGQVVSGWHMRNVHLPARVREPHSETAYMTDQAIRFMRDQGERALGAAPELREAALALHGAGAVPRACTRADQCLPVVRSEAERDNAHPVVAAYRQQEECVSFQRDDCIRTVRPAYQGLIHQLDDHLGRLFDHMERQGLLKDTLVIFTADHGDFLGDHWLGEKELFYDTVQKVPFIVADPRPAADATRGTVDERFVEGVDVVPTVLDWLGVAAAPHRIEGRSLLPLLEGQSPAWRDFAYSELDYSFREARLLRGKTPQQARAFSIRTERWRYVHWIDEPEQLYDLADDPQEMQDLGRDAGHADVRAGLRDRLLDFLVRRKHRTTVSDSFIELRTNQYKKAGVFFGQW